MLCYYRGLHKLHARNMHANSTLCTNENLCMVLIPLFKNNLNLPISLIDHYGLRI